MNYTIEDIREGDIVRIKNGGLYKIVDRVLRSVGSDELVAMNVNTGEIHNLRKVDICWCFRPLLSPDATGNDRVFSAPQEMQEIEQPSEDEFMSFLLGLGR